ncbi:MAG TPA: hypothetical protein VH041_16995 [Caldimonas sp.]|nr:hypothetical protein [Caldimonas sp.]
MNKIELKLGLPEAAAPSVSERLAHLGARVAQIESSYWDSADHRLASARMSLHSAQQRYAGRLAEFLVASDLGVSTGFRRGWLGHDLTAEDRTKIEAKSAAFVQGWAQRKPSLISFSN